MKPIFWVIVCLIASPFVIAIALYAGTDPAALNEWDVFMQAIKGNQGLNSFGLTIAAVQAIIMFFGDRFLRLPGKYKLLIVQSLSMLTGVTVLRGEGFDWQSAIMHSNTLGAIQVLGHQFLKQFRDDKEPKLELPTK